MDASKLLFEDLSEFSLKDLGFERNDYDWCVVNKIINGKQCTIMWHVDDLTISHVDPDIITGIINGLSAKYGCMMPLPINLGKIHKYLGMVFDFSASGAVTLTMHQYLDGMIKHAPEIYNVSFIEHGAEISTPAPINLYDVRNPDTEGNLLLTIKEHHEYHSLTAQCLYVSKIGRQDLHTSTLFHCTMVQKADTDDQKNLSQTICHLVTTIHLPLII